MVTPTEEKKKKIFYYEFHDFVNEHSCWCNNPFLDLPKFGVRLLDTIDSEENAFFNICQSFLKEGSTSRFVKPEKRLWIATVF